jgi:hypothetical protein
MSQATLPYARLLPFFSYYGSKWTLARKYPAPAHDVIIEPFAGSACYSLHYPDRRVVLVEKNPLVAATWRYLLEASPEDIRALPLLDSGQRVSDLDVSPGARLLIGWWVNSSTSSPCNVMTPRQSENASNGYACAWGHACKERIASQVDAIRHWSVIEGEYTEAPDVEATWFVDPPYQGRPGSHYPNGSKSLDFDALGSWCQARRGRVIV